MRATVRWLAGGFAVGVIVAGAFFWRQHTEPPPIAAAPAPAPVADAPARLARRIGAPARPEAPLLLPAVDDTQPVGIQVERLLATADPAKAYAAYLLVSGCALVNAGHEAGVRDDELHAPRAMNARERQALARTCGGMTERQRMDRLDHLAIAVKAGVPGALTAFAAEGPFGDPSALRTRPDDPLVREWKASVVAQLTRAAEAGDVAVLPVWGFQNLGGSALAEPHPAQGYGYLLAFGMVHADRFGPGDATAQAYAQEGTLMNALGAGLTPQQRAEGEALARRIADQARTRRGHGGAARAVMTGTAAPSASSANPS